MYQISDAKSGKGLGKMTCATIALLALVSLCLLVSVLSDQSDAVNTVADTFSYENESVTLYYTITEIAEGENNGEVQVLYDSSYQRYTEIIIPAVVTNEGFSYDVKTFEDTAFSGLSDLKYVMIEADLSTFDEAAFDGCYQLEGIDITDESTTFYSVDGVVFSNVSDVHELLMFPSARTGEYTVPQAVQKIGKYAFEDVVGLSLTIGSNVTEIYESSFESSYLSKLILPDSITTMELPTDVDFYNGETEITDPANIKGKTWIGSGVIPESGNYVLYDSSATGEYTITFDAGSGESSSYQMITVGGRLPEMPIAEREGFEFRGWNDGTSWVDASTALSENSTVYAKWNVISENVRYNVNTEPSGNTAGELHAAEIIGNVDSVHIRDTISVGSSNYKVSTINEWIFNNNDYLKEIVIGANVVITTTMIDEIPKLESIRTLNTNEYVSHHNGVLFDYDKTNLMVYPFGNTSYSYTLPNTIEEFDQYALYKAPYLSEIRVPANVSTLIFNPSSIVNCDSLGSIVSATEGKILEGMYTDEGFENRITISELKAIGSKTTVYLKWIDAGTFTKEYSDGLILGFELLDGTVGSEKVKVVSFTLGSTGTLDIPDTVESNSITYKVTELDFPYSEDDEIITVKIGNNVTHIPDGMFSNAQHLTTVTLGTSVSYIGDSTFTDTKITTINIPASVKIIGDYALKYNGELTTINVDESNTEYKSDEGVLFNKTGTDLIIFPAKKNTESYTVPDSVVNIQESAFSYNQYVKNISFGANLKDIGYSAFGYCIALESIVIPDSVTSMGTNVFRGCSALTSVTLGNGITMINTQTFDGCTSLTAINIPDSIVSIENYAFTKSGIESINIPDTVTSLGRYVFQECSKLTSVTIGSGITKINIYTFERCVNLENVTIEGKVTEIDNIAFSRCTALKSIDLPDCLERLGNQAFSFSGLETITLGKYVTLGNLVFLGCDSLTSINVNDANTEIADLDGVLYDKDLKVLISYPEARPGTSFSIPDSVTKIESNAFQGSNHLTEITLGSGTVEIGGESFRNCDVLKTIIVNTNIESIDIGSRTFQNCDLELISADPEKGILFFKDLALTEQMTGDELTDDTKKTVYFRFATKYTVEFDTSGMVTIPTAIEVLDGMPYGELPTLSRDGFTFEGWFNDDEEEVLSTTIVDISEDITLYALWTVTMDDVQYSVDYAPVTDVPGEVSLFDVGDTITELVIPKSITVGSEVYTISYVEWYAFHNATALKTITLNADIEFSESNYDKCDTLEEFHVASDHSTAMSIDGIVFSKDKTTILMYPEARPGAEYILPKEVENIGDYAFEDNTNLERLLFSSKDVTEFIIGDEPFYGTSLTFGDAVDGYIVAFFKDNTFETPLLDTDIPTFESCPMYAEWTIGYAISFDPNGGTGTMESVETIGNYVLPANGFTAPTEMEFKCWSVGGVEKNVGDTIEVTAPITVIAVWKEIIHDEPLYVPSTEGDVTVNTVEIGEGQTTTVTDVFEDSKTDDKKVVLEIDDMRIEFDAAAVSAIGGNAVTINAIVKTEGHGIDGALKVIQVKLVGATFPDGKVTVSIPFTDTVPEGKVVKVYYIDGDEKVDMNAVVSEGHLVFETNHFSDFAVFIEDVPAPSDSGNDGGFPVWAIVLIVVAVIAVAGGVGGYFFLQQKKKV